MRTLWIILLSVVLNKSWGQASHYEITGGTVTFRSDAPLELIEAKSAALQGIIDPNKNTFAFKVKIQTFEGFNAPLQRVHFNENYMESGKFPSSTFTGKIIENVDLTQDGNHTIRTKGKLTIHGVTQERIIKSDVSVSDSKLKVSARFTVLLKEHNITIPKIVYQKIAEEIKVIIEADFSTK